HVEGLLQCMEAVLEGSVDGPLRARGQSRPGGAGPVVDEPAVALVGRDAAGRGVGPPDVAKILEQRHVVVYGGGRYRAAELPGQRLGADRLAGADILPNNRPQNRTFTRIQQ